MEGTVNGQEQSTKLEAQTLTVAISWASGRESSFAPGHHNNACKPPSAPKESERDIPTCQSGQEMAIQSRSRSTRRSGERAHPAPPTPADAAQEAPPQHHNNEAHRPPRPHPASPPASDDANDDEADSRPAKKRKLSIRSKQTTLDHHFIINQSHAAPPPAPKVGSVTQTQVRGTVPQPVNGVRKLLDIEEDELAGGLAPLKPNKRPKTPVQGSRETPGKQEEKRTLRSQDDGPRLKSDLAIYFPNYEDIIFDTPREEELINLDSVLYITDDAPKQVKSEQQASPTSEEWEEYQTHSVKLSQWHPNQWLPPPPTTLSRPNALTQTNSTAVPP